jgi:DNA-binding LacI/PurR family transcriptional regulator
MPAVRLKDIAAELGLSVTAVSLALNDHPKIPPARRRQVKACAERLGYERNPLLSALSSYRSRSGPIRYAENIAWLILAEGPNDPIVQSHPPPPQVAPLGAHAEKLGYKLEVLYAGRTPAAQRRASKILRTRGIRGVVIDPWDADLAKVELEWDRLAAVCLTSNLSARPILSIHGDHFAATRDLLRELKTRGYRRPGLVITAVDTTPALLEWLGGYEATLLHEGWTRPIEPRIFTGNSFDGEVFTAWLNKHRPDVIVGPQGDWLIPWIERTGRSVPDDIGFCSVDVEPAATPRVSGMCNHRAVVWRVAIDVLGSQLRTNTLGPPAVPYTVNVKASWHEGRTLRPPRGG